MAVPKKKKKILNLKWKEKNIFFKKLTNLVNPLKKKTIFYNRMK